MTIDDIVRIIREDHGGAWWGLFSTTERGHKFMPTGHVLTPAAYDAVRAKFGAAPCSTGAGSQDLTAAERKRNALRHRAEQGHD